MHSQLKSYFKFINKKKKKRVSLYLRCPTPPITQYVYYNHITTKITRTMSNGYQKKKKIQTQQPQISSPPRIQPIYPKKGMISATPKTVRITVT